MTIPEVHDLYTIGHSNHPIEHVLGLLGAHGVTEIADVRSRPFSRRFPWFSQPPLAERLRQEGIAYTAWGDRLGGRPADPALYCNGVVDYEAVAATPPFRAALDAVTAASRETRMCLMCAEREPLDCHRCLLVARALAERGLRIAHILADGSAEPHAATEDRLLAATKVETDLFARRRPELLAEAYRRRSVRAAFRSQ